MSTSRFWEIGFDQDSNLDLRGAGWYETRLQTRLAISSFSQVSLSATFLFQHANFPGDRYLFSNTNERKMQQKFSEFIEYSSSQICCLSYSAVEYCSKETQDWDFNKFRQQRQMIQITKKMLNCFSTKMKEKNLKIFWSTCLYYLRKEKVSENKVNVKS